MNGYGPLDAQLWIVGSYPTVEDVKMNQPFTGATGRILTAQFLEMGLNPTLVRYEYMVYQRPPTGKEFEYFSDGEGFALLTKSLSELKARIKSGKPNIILCLGAQPLKYLMNRTDVSEWRGHLTWNKELDCKMMCTYHPLDALKQLYVEEKEKPGQYEILLANDIAKACKQSLMKEWKIPPVEIRIARDYQTMVAELDHLSSATSLAFDIETDGFCITCISFAPSASYSVCIPLTRVVRQSGVPAKVFNILPDEDEATDIWWRIKQLLQSPIPKIAQNSQFDMAVLRKIYGIRVVNLFHDTMVAIHNLYCDMPKSLGCLMSLYSEQPYHKNLYGSSNQEEFWEYNARDSLVTQEICWKQIEEMKLHGVYDHYLTITHPTITVLVEMQVMGVLVDMAVRTSVAERELQLCELAEKGLKYLIGEDFSPASPKQLQYLLYDCLKCPIQYNKGKPTVNDTARQKLIKQFPNTPIAIICEALDKYAKAAHMYNIMDVELENSRMHTAYDITGTNTGRLNSKESIFGTGTNLQNLQKGPPRRMLIPG